MSLTTAHPVVDDLRKLVAGRVVTPDEKDYDEVRKVLYDFADSHPAAVVRVANAEDVAAVVNAARESGLELAVRSGGHSGAGHSTTDGGLVIDLRDLHSIDVDAAARTAWAQAGATAAEVASAADAHGLAVGFGDTGSVGIGGITSGGGIGYLTRKYGLTIDSVLAADVVTADGRIRRVDADHDPDLFWAIRGGAGNAGVVTRFLYRLEEVGDAYGGMLFLPATADTIAGFVAAAQAAPEELGTILNVMPAFPMPFIPEDQVGKLVAWGMIFYAGPPADGEKAVAPFRALATPIADLVRPMRYPEMFPPEEPQPEDAPKFLPSSRILFMDHIDTTVAQSMIDTIATAPDMGGAQIRVLGGEMARVPADATAFPHRTAPIMTAVVGLTFDPTKREANEQFVDAFKASLDQGVPGAYVNFLNDEGPDRVHDAYPDATWKRLAEIKAKYDPTNLFRRNQNVPPASA
ncbi:MAG TPA: FAD-binding oxidoreductase [Candidatus Limnocylindrales bacterium]|nr:FAD-binding oxidoreductase [Candidatus Limnocylindrales bacterium]